MYGTREYRFSYTNENGEQQFVFLHTANVGGAAYLLNKRSIKFTDLKRAPKDKTKPLTTGTCQICGREIGTTTGKIAHHGYTRPGTGWQTASCFGAKWRPYEVACDAIQPCIDGLVRWVEGLEAANADMLASPPATISYKADKYEGGRYVTKTYTLERPADFDPKIELTYAQRYQSGSSYAKHFHNDIAQRRSWISASKADIVILKQRLADWKAPK